MKTVSMRSLAAIAALAALAGCASPARVDQMAISAKDVSASSVPEALKSNIAIKDVTGGKETNPMWVSNVGSADFERALEASLKAVGMLSANRQAGRYQLTAHLEKLDQPLLGFSMTVVSTVRYVVYERATGKEIFNRSIVGSYTAAASDAFIGSERLKLANEGSMRVNITQFIGELQRLSIAAVTL
jgi:outer membrane murein-binding lipoprotein Lpp